MSTRTNTTVALKQLSGKDFRSEELACAHCCWQGRAGMLVVPGSAGLADTVNYCCPRCHQIIAEHAGLSTDEVQQELLAIRQMLAVEFRRTLELTDAGSREQVGPSFSVVRERLKGIEEV